MANIKSFPNNQDEYIGAEYVMKWLHGRTSGVFAGDDNAAVTALATPAMAVQVSDGTGWMADSGKDGVVWWIDSEETSGAKLQLPINIADGVLNRIDRIVVEWKTTTYADLPEIKVLAGTASSTPAPPALTNNSTVRQICLAEISVPAGTTAITASMITDTRLNSAVCGLVSEYANIDTSTMQAQFSELLEKIQAELDALNDGSGTVLSVNGKSGVVQLTAADVAALATSGGTVNGQLIVNGLVQLKSTLAVVGALAANGNFYANGNIILKSGVNYFASKSSLPSSATTGTLVFVKSED